jgi:excisionase family DNA binding protein
MQATQTQALLTVPEFAAALRVHPASIYRRIQSGEIEARRIGAPPGGRFRISADELDRLLERVDDGSPQRGSFVGTDARRNRPPPIGLRVTN